MFIIYQIVKFFFSISNPKSRVEKDRNYGLIKLRDLADNLIPFDSEEMSLLSGKRNATPSRKTFHSEEFGHLSTIYNEHLIAYYLFDYLDERKLLLTETTDVDVELYREGGVTHVWVNGSLLYHIDQIGRLFSVGNNQVYASISSGAKLSHHTISVRGEVRAHLTANDGYSSAQERAYPIIEVKNKEESIMIYCLTLYNLFIK